MGNWQQEQGFDLSPYQERGFKNREDYLESLAEEHGDAEMVFACAEVLGPSEDFDGLVSMLEDR